MLAAFHCRSAGKSFFSTTARYTTCPETRAGSPTYCWRTADFTPSAPIKATPRWKRPLASYTVTASPSCSIRCACVEVSTSTAYGLPKRLRNASPVGTRATSVSSSASCMTISSTYTARLRAFGPTPSASNAANAFGPSWMPAPISPKCGDCSSTLTLKPWRLSANAAARPPMPPPTTSTGREEIRLATSASPRSRLVGDAAVSRNYH